MKFVNKLVLPVLAISLIASSAFAGRRPVIVEPSLGNLVAITICNAMVGTATYMAVDKLISDPILNIPSKLLAAGYWIKNEYELIQEYKRNKAEWEYYQAVKKLNTYWNSRNEYWNGRSSKLKKRSTR